MIGTAASYTMRYGRTAGIPPMLHCNLTRGGDATGYAACCGRMCTMCERVSCWTGFARDTGHYFMKQPGGPGVS